MRTRPMGAILIAGLVLAAAAAQGQSTPPAPSITVTVDGRPVAFAGAQPQEIGDAVLVPLRGVFQQMGASVSYDQAARTVRVKAGTSSIDLPLGASSATVNGKTKTLAQPAVVVDGATLVPLRFVAESFGAYVGWNAAARSVKIVTPAAHLSQLPAPPASLGPTFIGQLVEIDTNTAPMRLSVRDDSGEVAALPISPAATFEVGYGEGMPLQTHTPDRFKPGDQIAVTRGSGGAAVNIEGIYGRVTGTVKSIAANGDGSHVVNLTDGMSVTLIADAPVAMARRRIDIKEVMPAERVAIRTSQDNKTGYGMAVVTAGEADPAIPGAGPGDLAPPAPHSQAQPARPGLWLADETQPAVDVAVTITSFTAKVAGPVRAGDKIPVTLTGSPGGRASFAVPNVCGEIPLSEAAPGVYIGALTVPKSANAARATPIGRLVGKDGTAAPLMPAKERVWIDNDPPSFWAETPPRGATLASGRVVVYAALTDGAGTGVNPQSVQLFLDGANVTRDCRASALSISYRPPQPLSPGRHTALVVAQDDAGNQARSEWSFQVASSDASQGNPAPLWAGAADGDAAVSADKPLPVSYHGEPGESVVCRLPAIPHAFPLREISAGTYQGTYSPVPGASCCDTPLLVMAARGRADPVVTLLDREIAVRAPAPPAPVILQPDSSQEVGDTLDIEGRAAPGALVLVTISYKSESATGLFEIEGDAASLSTRADEKGSWKIDHVGLSTPWLLTPDRTTRFTIQAVAVDSAGGRSEAAACEVMHG